MPDDVTVILEFVDPVVHKYPFAFEEVSVIEFPLQLVSGPLEVTVGIAGADVALTVVGAEVPVHVPEVMVTE